MANKTSFLTAVAVAGWAMLSQAHADTTPTPTDAAQPVDAARANATPANPIASTRDFHIGVNFRTDFGARYYRADVGTRFGRWDITLVVDPLGIPKGDYDFDAILRYVGDRWSIWGGARLSIVPIAREHQFTEKALVGVSAQLPSPFGDKVRIHSGLELAAHLRSHGGDVMTRWICVDSPDCREDHFVFGLFGRMEYASPF